MIWVDSPFVFTSLWSLEPFQQTYIWMLEKKSIFSTTEYFDGDYKKAPIPMYKRFLSHPLCVG